MNRIKHKNIGKQTIRFEIAHRPGEVPELFVVEPGDTCEIPAGYCQSAGPRGSFVDRRGKGKLVPVTQLKEEKKPEPKKVERPAPTVPVMVEPKPEKKEEAPKKAKRTRRFKKAD